MPMSRPHPISWLRGHPRGADAVMALIVAGVSVVFHLIDPALDFDYRPPSWWTVLLIIGSTLPIAWRRTFPIRSCLVVVSVQVIASLLDINGTGFIGVTIALYSIGAHTSGRRRRNPLIYVVSVLVLLFIAGVFDGQVSLGDLVSSFVVLVTAFVLGDNVRRRREKADGFVERAERAQREQRLVAQQQVSAERTRIARELHDVVAHSVSVMVIQAAAARRNLHTSPANAEIALSSIEDTGRQTMNELRGILGVLRANQEHDGARLPQPTLAEIGSLINADGDLPIDVQITGSLTDLANSTTLTGYRVVQESLTNVRRHAGPVKQVDIRIERGPHLLRIAVIDDGRGAAADASGPGYGIVGMSERVAAIGGSFDAGPRPGGGWRVVASMPTSAGTPVGAAT